MVSKTRVQKVLSSKMAQNLRAKIKGITPKRGNRIKRRFVFKNKKSI